MTPRIENEARIDVLTAMAAAIGQAEVILELARGDERLVLSAHRDGLIAARAAVVILIDAAQIHLQANDEISADGLLIALHRVTGGDA